MKSSCDNSIILIDKPSGVTSFDVIKRLRRITGIKRIGHAGVLDKPASGLLVCATGRATRLLSIFEDGYKIYQVDVLFGIQTDTYDITGRITNRKDGFKLTQEQLRSVLEMFVGEIEQSVPPFSNVKVGGRKLYEYALKGEKVELPKRRVHIRSIELEGFDGKKAKLTISCSKGTYVRTLVNDVGLRLGVFACVAYLRRIFSYPFSLDGASDLDNPVCIPIEKALSYLPSLRVSPSDAVSVSNGVPFNKIFDIGRLNNGLYRVLAGSRFVALVEKKGRQVKYRFILPTG